MDVQRLNRAIELRDTGEETEALREFEELASLESDAEEVGSLMHNQAVCLWRLGRLCEARQRLSEAEQLWPNIYTEGMDARLSIAEGDEEGALRKLTTFFEKYGDPIRSDDKQFYADTLEALGFLLFKLQRFGEATGPLGKSLALSDTDDNRRQRLFYLGMCHFQLGEGRIAEHELTASFPADCHHPRWARAKQQLGCLYFSRGLYLDARNSFELAECFEKDADHLASLSEWLAAVRLRLAERNAPNA